MVQNWHSGAANFDIATKFLLGSKLFGEGPSATLHYTYASEQYPIQIGNRFAVTAAHCLFDESKEEVLTSCLFGPVSKLAVRCKILCSFVIRLYLPVSSPSCLASTTEEIWRSQTGSNLMLVARRTMRVSKVIVHKEFSHTIHDIALLQLGKN